MDKIDWKNKILENVLSKKNWAFYCVAFVVIINSLFNIGIEGENIERLVWLAIGLFAGDGLTKIGEGLKSKKDVGPS